LGEQHLGTLVIGGSQSGLAVGYYLGQRALPFVILDENDRIADAWRRRWDSLRFMGLPLPYSLSSALLGGVGRDARHIVDHIASTGTPTERGIHGPIAAS
jgi:hypothetical protein